MRRKRLPTIAQLRKRLAAWHKELRDNKYGFRRFAEGAITEIKAVIKGRKRNV
jgi:hypothetical protein